MPGECKRTLVIYGSEGKSDDLLLFPPSSEHVCFQTGATDEFLVSLEYAILYNWNNILLSQRMSWESGCGCSKCHSCL